MNKEQIISQTIKNFETEMKKLGAMPLICVGMTFEIKNNFVSKFKNMAALGKGKPVTVVGPNISDELLITILNRELMETRRRLESKKGFMKKLQAD